MSYRIIQTEFENVIASTAWTSFGITTVPMNYQGPVGSKSYVRVGVFFANAGFGQYGGGRSTGFVEANIFTLVGEGEKQTYEIADNLDTVFQGKTIGSMQFFESNLIKVGIDRANKTLWRVDYRIPYASYL